MSVTPGFRAFVLDQLRGVVSGVRDRAMFGGVGIYAGELFFALIDEDTLYLKVDDSNRPDFEAKGLGPFRPFGPEGEVMQYYELSGDILEDPHELRTWVTKAIDVARRKRKPGSGTKPRAASPEKKPGPSGRRPTRGPRRTK